MMNPLTRIILATFVSTIVGSHVAQAGCGAGTGACATISSMITTTVTSSMFTPSLSSTAAPVENGPAAPVSELSSDHHSAEKEAK